MSFDHSGGAPAGRPLQRRIIFDCRNAVSGARHPKLSNLQTGHRAESAA